MLSSEARLVYRTADPGCTSEELRALAGSVQNWERVLRLVEHEGATSALWRLLKSAGDTPPAALRERLRAAAMISDFRMQALADRAREVVRSLAEYGVPVILLKGAAVGAMVDPSFRSRPMSDLDLLVHPSDADRAREAIVAAGWPPTTDPRLLELLRDQHHLPPFVHPQLPGTRLELHTALLPHDHSFALDTDRLWRDAVPAAPPFTGAQVLELHTMAVHLCIHFAWQHTAHFAPWRACRALGLLAADGRWDWDRFARTAVAAKAGTACYWTLRLASRLEALDPPPAVLQQLAPPTPEWLMRIIERHFVANLVPGELPQSPSTGLARWLWIAALRPGWSGHRVAGRMDPDRRWERAFGHPDVPPAYVRLGRQARDYQAWWRFLSQTLLGR